MGTTIHKCGDCGLTTVETTDDDERLDAATELLRRLPGLLSDEGCGQFATCEEWNEALLALVADTAAFLGDGGGKEGGDDGTSTGS
jgi:hypothetical protein